MPTPVFVIYSQAPVVLQGLKAIIRDIAPSNRVLSADELLIENTIEVFEEEIHFFPLGLEGNPYRSKLDPLQERNSQQKLILCPFLNDLRFVPIIKEYDFDALISLEMLTPHLLKNMLQNIAQPGGVYIHPFFLIEITKTKYERIVSCLLSITPREHEILNKIKLDKTNGEIAAELDLSIRTVNAHKRNLLKKFNANSMEYVIDVISNYQDIFQRYL